MPRPAKTPDPPARLDRVETPLPAAEIVAAYEALPEREQARFSRQIRREVERANRQAERESRRAGQTK